MEIKTKQELRTKILTLLKRQKEEERLSKSLRIQAKLFEMHEFRNAKVLLFYASFNGEVDTFEMIKEALKLNKNIGLPKIDQNSKRINPVLIHNLDKDLEDGPYGVKQPKGTSDNNRLNQKDIDAVIVPGVAFDKACHRLGRGAGYYDRFLAELPKEIPTIGLAFDFQVVECLPQLEKHDMSVSHVLCN